MSLSKKLQTYFQYQCNPLNSGLQFRVADLMNNSTFQKYQQASLAHFKNIREYSFMKKYPKICEKFPYVSQWRPVQLEVAVMRQIVTQIYQIHLGFLRRGWWKKQTLDPNLQEFLTLFLLHWYQNNTFKKSFASFDRFLLGFMFTLNILKTTNKFYKTFCLFLSDSLSPTEFFVYLCMINVAVTGPEGYLVGIQHIKEMIQVFQKLNYSSVSIDSSKQQSFISFHGISEFENCLKDTVRVQSKNSCQQKCDKLVEIDKAFQEPTSHGLVLPKLQMYKIMAIYQMVDESEQRLKWQNFLEIYFDDASKYQEYSYEHILSLAVVKSVYKLSKKLELQSDDKTQFLEQAFSYVFQVLELIFFESRQDLGDRVTENNLEDLRSTFRFMKKFDELGIVLCNKFTQKIMKNSFLLHLTKKYRGKS